MKLASFHNGSHVALGEVRDDTITEIRIETSDGMVVNSMQSYLETLPLSRELVEEQHRHDTRDGTPLRDATLLSPIPHPPMLLDCSVAPRHLRQAAVTLLSRSMPRPIAVLAGPLIRPTVSWALARQAHGRVLYYKARTTSVVGDSAVIPWPAYTAYLDIEPELAVVVGEVPLGTPPSLVAERIAGYTIFNDVSARDVQLREMIGGGPAASKDMDNGNVLGPWLVTADEFGDPLDHPVHVTTDRGRAWHGTTADYSHDPITVIAELAERQHLSAGTVIGMGTVADTCGLERDEWIEPGEHIAITIDGIGTLHQQIGIPAQPPTSPWASRHLQPTPPQHNTTMSARQSITRSGLRTLRTSTPITRHNPAD
ncbi:fumarylacetoacetate hydrolase family protein [Nocardia vaccinii]|uniref:fumarylacetoacetate hydrolase family protein n=1 Tax=Nocardia vaccinii TaxID=1822 RepID=UPI000836984D|nr:fumarylacetoacetate hydrolase family protein [Nocardia vaccinii]